MLLGSSIPCWIWWKWEQSVFGGSLWVPVRFGVMSSVKLEMTSPSFLRCLKSPQWAFNDLWSIQLLQPSFMYTCNMKNQIPLIPIPHSCNCSLSNRAYTNVGSCSVPVTEVRILRTCIKPRSLTSDEDCSKWWIDMQLHMKRRVAVLKVDRVLLIQAPKRRELFAAADFLQVVSIRKSNRNGVAKDSTPKQTKRRE